MCLRYEQLMQVRRLAIHDGFESEKRDFILNPLSDREFTRSVTFRPVAVLEMNILRG